MSPPYELILVGNTTYYAPPYSLLQLPETLHSGLAAIGALATTSILALVLLIVFVSYRLGTWRSYYTCFPGGNQCVILILNLLLADLQQSIALSISFHWLRVGSILAPSAPCSLQAWLLHSGDVSSGLFVLAIAIHTSLTTVAEKEISSRVFFSALASLWILTFFLASLGVAMHGSQYFVRAGPWCWVSEAYEGERLGLHYFWLFLCQAGAIAIYSCLAAILLRRVRQYRAAARRGTFVTSGRNQEISRVAKLMIIYPIAYVVLTLPLAVGRMWSMARNGKAYSEGYAVFAGCMITSCGFVDVILYSLTRRRLLVATGMEPDCQRSLHSRVSVTQCEEDAMKGVQETEVYELPTRTLDR